MNADGVKTAFRRHKPVLVAIMFVCTVLIAMEISTSGDEGFWSITRELTLIVLGVLVALLFLPTTEDTIDKVELRLLRSPEVLRSLSDDAASRLVTGIIAARSGDDVAGLATRHGWKPIVDAAARSSIVRHDVNYLIELEPERFDEHDFMRVRTTLEAQRALPVGDELWVSFAKTWESLRSEYGPETCLSRELVEAPAGADWERLHAQFGASLRIGENHELPRAGVEPVGDDAVRFRFSRGGIEHRPDQVVVQDMSFLTNRDITYFPVKFSNYFCMGRTKIRFAIKGQVPGSLEAAVHFAGDTHLDPTNEVQVRPQDTPADDRQVIEVSTTSSDVVLWPGSGVVFVWRS